ncbi:MAG TPA: hypothetical protein PLE32_20670 [Haliscomenobacter sp.]|nr:hypothetical protein [Haliscomenobacter sp.]
MKHFTLISMSLLSFLFGCGKRDDKPKQNLPWFPNIDNVAIKVVEMPVDSGYAVQTFLISKERQEIFVLAHNKINPNNTVEERWRTDYQLLCFGANGQLRKRVDLPKFEFNDPAHLWIEHKNLVLFLNDKVRLFDTERLELSEEIPYYAENSFPTKTNLEALLPEEQLERYLPAREKHLKVCPSVRVLNLPKAGGCVLLAQAADETRTIWSLIDSVDVDKYTRQYGMIEAPLNPGWKYNPETGLFKVSDAALVLETTGEVSMGTQLDYPNYKSRSAMQYVLNLDTKTARFATTNRSRKPLYVQISQNDYLSASGSEAWIAYQGTLYRVE